MKGPTNLFGSLSLTAKFLTLATITTLVVLGVGGGLTLYYLSENKDTTQLSLKEEEQVNIFKKIIQNNPASLLEKHSEQVKRELSSQNPLAAIPPVDANVSVAEEKKEDLKEQIKVNQELANLPPTNESFSSAALYRDEYNYNYTYSKSTTKYGSAIDQCNALKMYTDGNSDEEVSQEYYDYFEPGRKYYFKSQTLGQQDQLIDYRLSLSDASASYIVYRGGSYAIKLTYPPIFTQSSPSSYPVIYSETNNPTSYAKEELTPPSDEDYMDLIESYFGAGVKIVDIREIEGKKYIILKRDYQQICHWDAESESLVQGLSKIEVVYYVDDVNFEIKTVAYYLESEAIENLLYEINFSQERKLVNESEVASLFRYEFDKPFKELDGIYRGMYNSKEYYDALLEHLKTKNLDMLVPQSEQLDLSYVFSEELICITQWCNLYYARDFYPEGDWGERLHNDVLSPFRSNDVRPISALTLLYLKDTSSNGNPRYFVISFFPSDQSQNKIRNSNLLYSYLDSEKRASSGVSTLNIGGLENSAKYYEHEIFYKFYSPSSYPASYLQEEVLSYPTSYPEYTMCLWNGCFYKSGFIVGGTENSNFSIGYSGDDRLFLEGLAFQKFNTWSEADISSFGIILRSSANFWGY